MTVLKTGQQSKQQSKRQITSTAKLFVPDSPTKQTLLIVFLIYLSTCLTVVSFLFELDEYNKNICICFVCLAWFMLIFSI